MKRSTPTWKKTPPPVQEESRRKRARRLPLPGPGIVVTVPLSFLPEYLELYRLVPMTPGEVMQLETRSKHTKPGDVLWVRRAKGGAA